MSQTQDRIRIATVRRISGSKRQRRSQGLSLQMQAEQCHQFALANGGVVVHEIEWPARSSWAMTEKDYRVLIDLARARQIDAVLMFRMDRFGRQNGLAIDRCDALDFKYGVKIWTVMEGMNLPKDVRDRKLTEAAQESIANSQRVYPAMRAMAEAGLWPSRPPFGYELDKTHFDDDGEILRGYIRPHPPTHTIVQEMFRRIEADETIYAVTQWLNREHAQWADKGWYAQTVLHILRNPVYVGLVEYDRECNSRFAQHGKKDPALKISRVGQHQPIIEHEQFARVQRKLDVHAYRASRSEKKARQGRQSALRGLVRCALCGGSMRLKLKYHESGTGTPDNPCAGATYRCNVLTHPSVGVNRVQRYVLEQLDAIVLHPQALLRARRRLESAAAAKPVDRRAQLVAERADMVAAIDRAGLKLARGVMTDDDYLRTVDLLKENIAHLDGQIAACPERVDGPVLYREAERYAATLGRLRPLLEEGLASNNPACIDKVAEALSATLVAVVATKGRDPVIQWQPWVQLLVDQPEILSA